MNEYNDRGERHGYWETNFSITNYYNGIHHGEYKHFMYGNKSEICLEVDGRYDMGVMIGCWKWYDTNGELYFKEYHL